MMSSKLKKFSKNKNNKDNNASAGRKSTSTISTSTSSSAHPFPPPYIHNHTPQTFLQSLLETTSTKLTDGTKYALSAITPIGIVDTYLSPVIRYFHQLYFQQPEGGIERFGMWGCLVVGGLPVVCVGVGLGMSCVGGFVVTGSALFLIQMFGLGFMGCILAPAGLLTVLFLGLPSLTIYGIYSSCSFLLSCLF